MGLGMGVKAVYGGITDYIIPFVQKILEGWNKAKWLMRKGILAVFGLLFHYSVIW